MVNVQEVHRGLDEVAGALLRLLNLSPRTPIPLEKPRPLRIRPVESVVLASHELYMRASEFYEHLMGKEPIPVFNMAFVDLYFTIYYLNRLVNDMDYICRAVKGRLFETYPDICYVLALDVDMEMLLGEFKGLSERIPHLVRWQTIELIGRNFLNKLKSFSVTCSWATETTCLRYAGPESVTPASLRTYLSDLLSAIHTLDRRLIDLYFGVKRWRVGVIELYEHPQTTPELSELAEYAANILNKLVEMGVLTWKPVVVYSLQDRITIAVEAYEPVSFFKNIVIKPGWAVDIYMSLLPEPFRVLKRVLSERGFKTEETGHLIYYKLRVSIPPGDVRELLKTALPTMTLTGTNEEELYKTALGTIEMLESKLRVQKPLRKRKTSL